MTSTPAERTVAPPQPTVAGLVLAAGAGSRFGSPKALARGTDGEPWLSRAVRVLHAAGCTPVVVVLGAEGAAAEALLLNGATGDGDGRQSAVATGAGAAAGAGAIVVVHAAEWAEGLSASLRAGLAAVAALAGPAAVVVVPVDVPDLDVATVARVLGARPARGGAAPDNAAEGGTDSSLRQAVFGGRPGHPVLIGRAHWAALRESLTGDTGARPYLVAHGVLAVECGDLATGLDVDTRPGAARR